MIRYTIKLTKSEVEELVSIVKKGSHKSQSYQAAYILLNTDEGDYFRKVTNERICKGRCIKSHFYSFHPFHR
jgi:hypothetical protein